MADPQKKPLYGAPRTRKTSPLRAPLYAAPTYQEQAPEGTQAYRALRSGALGTGASLRDAEAALDVLLGNAAQAEEERRKARALRQRAAEMAPDINRLEDVEGPVDLGALARNKVLENAPLVGGLALSGGAGGAASRFLRLGTKPGALAGTATGYGATATGENYGALQDDPDAMGTDKEKAAASVAAGGAQTLLGLAPLSRAASALRTGSAGTRRIAAEAAATEAVTEVGEQGVQRFTRQQFNPDVGLADDEALSEYANAAFAGGVGGGTVAGTASGTVQGMRYLDQKGLGNLARRAAERAKEAGQDPLAAVRRAVNENADLVDDPDAALAGLDSEVAGVRPRSGVEGRAADMEAEDDVREARFNQRVSQLRDTADEETHRALDAIEESGPWDEEAMAQLDALSTRYQREPMRATTRAAAGHFKEPIRDIFQFEQEVMPVVNAVVDGQLTLDQARPQLEQAFEDPMEMLDKVASQTGSPARFRLDDLLTKIETGEAEFDADTIEQLRDLAGTEQAADAVVERDLFEVEGDGVAGEGDVEYFSTSIGEGPSTNYHLNDRGQPWLSQSGAQLKHGRAFDTDAATTRAARLQESNPNSEYRVVPYREVASAEALEMGLTGAEREQFLTEQGEKLLQREPDLAAQVASPAEALDLFSAVRRVDPPNATNPRDALDLTEEELTSPKSEGKKRRLRDLADQYRDITEQAEDIAFSGLDETQVAKAQRYTELSSRSDKESLRELTQLHNDPQLEPFFQNLQAANQIRKSAQEVERMGKDLKNKVSSILRKPGPPGKPRHPWLLPAKRDGKDVNVDAMRLVKTMMGRRNEEINATQNEQELTDRVGDTFATGMASLMNTEGFELDGPIPDDLVVFKTRGGKEITYGQVKYKGAAQLRDSLRRARNAYRQAKSPDQKAKIARRGKSLRSTYEQLKEQEKNPRPPRSTGQFDRSEVQETTGKEAETPFVDSLVAREQRFRDDQVDQAVQQRIETPGFRGKTIKYQRVPGEARDALIEADSVERRERLQATAKGWLDQLGLDVDVAILDVEAAEQVSEKAPHKVNGFSTWAAPGRFDLYVNPAMDEAHQLDTLAHEVGHVVERTAFFHASKPQKQAIEAEFEKWLAQYDGHSTLGEIYSSRATPTMALGMRRGDVRLEELSEADREYVLAFNEWFADNVAKWLQTKAAPKTVAEQFFGYVAELVSDLYALVKGHVPAKSVAEFLDALHAAQTHGAEQANVQSEQANEHYLRIAQMVKDTLGIRVKQVDPKSRRLRGKGVRFSPDQNVLWVTAEANEDTYSEATNAALRAAMRSDLLTPEEKGIVQHTFTRPALLRRLRRKLGPDAEALRDVNNDPEAAAAYAYQFWVAGELDLSEQSSSVLTKVRDTIRDTLGGIEEHAQAEQIMAAMRDGRLRTRREGRGEFVVKRRIAETRLQKVAREAEKVSEIVTPVLRKVVFDADSQLRALNNPWAEKLANQFQARVGTESVKESMYEARLRWRGRFTNILHSIYDGQDKAFGERLAAIMTGNATAETAAERKAEERTRKLLRQVWKYMRGRGVDIGDRGEKYFPRVYDVERLARDGDAFIAMLLQDKYKDVIKNERDARRLHKALMENVGDVESTEALQDDEVGTGRPFMASGTERTLGWIDDADAAPFLSRDIGYIMSAYIDQAVKRAEYTSRFGMDVQGAMPLEEYYERARATGASEADIERMQVNAQALLGTLGSDINPKFQKFQGAIMVYQNLTVLSLSTISSLVDPIGMLVRGDIDTLFAGLRAGVDEVKAKVAGDKTELRRLGEMLGTIDLYMTNEALGWEYGGHYVTGTARKVNEAFFNAIQLQRWTRNTRVMALAGAKSFIEKHAQGGYPDSERFIAQLGLQAGDVVLDGQGKLKILSNRERATADPKELARDDRVRAALNRWVDEAILRPNAAQRPAWASDPHWMLVFHLKAFTYSFHDRILKRVMSEAGEGNYQPMLHLAAFIPAAAGANTLRWGLQGMFDDDEENYRATWTSADYIGEAVQRAGLLGIGQFGVDAYEHGPLGLSGPSIEHLSTVPDLLIGDDREQWEAFTRSLPAGSLWKSWDAE